MHVHFMALGASKGYPAQRVSTAKNGDYVFTLNVYTDDDAWRFGRTQLGPAGSWKSRIERLRREEN